METTGEEAVRRGIAAAFDQARHRYEEERETPFGQVFEGIADGLRRTLELLEGRDA